MEEYRVRDSLRASSPGALAAGGKRKESLQLRLWNLNSTSNFPVAPRRQSSPKSLLTGSLKGGNSFAYRATVVYVEFTWQSYKGPTLQIWRSMDNADWGNSSRCKVQAGGRRHLQELKPCSPFLLNKELFINTEGKRELVVALTIASTIVIYLISALSV